MNHLDLLIGQTLSQLHVRLHKVNAAIERLNELEQYYKGFGIASTDNRVSPDSKSSGSKTE